jgi:RimJ/RimL family protein N-acetyltransferase
MKNQRKWFIEISKEESLRKMFVITVKGGNPIGVCGLINIDKENKSADVAIILGEKNQRGKHFGSESLKLLVNYGFKKLKLHRIGAEIFEYNKRSVNLFEKLNFKLEATMRDRLWREGKWWDVYLYSILSDDVNQL